nr:hypothetical protein [Tanacetum cinerariifolium]
MNLTMFKEVNSVVDLLEEVGSSSVEVVKTGKENNNKGENIKEVFDIRYKELEESKPILEVLENYVIYKKKLDEILMGKERLNKKDFSVEDKVGIIEHNLPKKLCDLRNYVLPMKINGVVKMVALVDTGASVSVLPYSLYKDLGLDDMRPYQTNLTMVDNTQAKAMGEVKNVRIHIGYQAYVVDLLVLDILVDPKLPLLLGRPFLRTSGAIIDMGTCTICIDDEVIRNFKVGRDEDGNTKYGPVAPSFLDIEDDMERALAMETYFNLLKNIIVFKKLVDFLGLLPKSRKDTLPNPLIADMRKGIKRIQSPTRCNLCQMDRSIGVPRIGNWGVFNAYGFEVTLRNMMKLEYIYEGDGDVFVDYSCDRALSINDEVYHEWVLEFFSTMYFDKDVDKRNLMTEKYEVNHRLFGVHFGKLEVDDRQFDHREYWTKVGKPTLTNHKEVLVREPLMRIVYKLIVGSLVHRLANHLYKHDSETKESSVICAGHYVTKIATYLEYCMDDEIKKCSEPIDCEYWKMKMLVEELDEKNPCLLKETGIPTQAGIGSSEQSKEPRGNSSWGDWNASLNKVKHGNVWRDSNLIRHYPNRGNQRNQGGGYGLGDDDYFTSAMTDFEGNTLRYAVGGSFRGAGFDDEDMDE